MSIMEQEGLSKNSPFDEQAEWLKKRINESLIYLEGQKEKNKRRASYLKLVVIIFSGIATILLGLQISSLSEIFKDAAFVLVSFVTLNKCD